MITYWAKQFGIMYLVFLIPASFVGMNKALVLFTFGYSWRTIIDKGILLFCVGYVCMAVTGTVVVFLITKEQATRAGMTFWQVARLTKDQRTKFDLEYPPQWKRTNPK